MKTLLTILLLCGAAFSQQGDMVRAEPLTPADQEARAKAYDALVKAQANVHEVEYQIAQRHHMKGEGDFGSIQHYEFDGGFIVLRNTSMIVNTAIAAPATPELGNVIVYQPQGKNSGTFRDTGTEPKRLMWANADNTGSCTIEIIP
jgi:hypothetical protein